MRRAYLSPVRVWLSVTAVALTGLVCGVAANAQTPPTIARKIVGYLPAAGPAAPVTSANIVHATCWLMLPGEPCWVSWLESRGSDDLVFVTDAGTNQQSGYCSPQPPQVSCLETAVGSVAPDVTAEGFVIYGHNVRSVDTW